ncbi:Nuclear mitotic apparatus 1 [Cucumis melo var. makuwa]|uniref:Nuclear mitotic apparatus 1 n=1 Tax=Cucumis melo var. makuwa TaxID=1194695 RepID=A0A5A7UJL3_CUCMM|nr:Nuclear mitotic apparatus 1 [Cucumis melo var. makuwa]
MEDSEKLTALKKAYADIILNTAKEAAARIMVSERNAIRCQQELSTTKDEAFRILLRLKQMLDSKVSEAEMVSLNQKKKIEELEAQLEEAEDIVRELRVQLQEVQDELEHVRNKNVEPQDKQNLASNIASREDFPNSHEKIAPYDISSTLNGTCLDSWPESKNDSQTDKAQVHRDFASMVMRSKEPELYRNGCTQRVRAFERKSFDGEVCLTGQAEDVKSKVCNMGEEEGKLMRKTNTTKADNISGERKNFNEIKALPKLLSGDTQVPILKSLRRKRKRATRYNKKKALTVLDDIPKQCKSPDLHCSESLSVDNDDAGNFLSKKEIDSQNGLILLSTPLLSEINEMPTPSGCPDASEGDGAVINDCPLRNMTDHDTAVVGKSDFASQESLCGENLEASTDKVDLDLVKESSIQLDMKNSDVIDEIPSQQSNNKVLKYTFQRKRKKESLSSPDGKSSVDESISKKRMKDKQSVSSESDKFSLMTESSRDNRRLAQVARQTPAVLGHCSSQLPPNSDVLFPEMLTLARPQDLLHPRSSYLCLRRSGGSRTLAVLKLIFVA